jgi:hypothetical protein
MTKEIPYDPNEKFGSAPDAETLKAAANLVKDLMKTKKEQK